MSGVHDYRCHPESFERYFFNCRASLVRKRSAGARNKESMRYVAPLVHSGVFDPRGTERVRAIRRAPRGEKTPLSAIRRRPQQKTGEICGLSPFTQEWGPPCEGSSHPRQRVATALSRSTNVQLIFDNLNSVQHHGSRPIGEKRCERFPSPSCLSC